MSTLTPRQLADKLARARCAVAFTGAGISTGAGIPDFRGPGGIYNSGRYDAERVFDIDHFRHDPTEFYRFTRDMAETAGRVEPTFTHRFLARLEEDGRLAGVVTQNIDPLHQQAGSCNVVSVHGSYATAHCLACGREFKYGQLLAMLDASPEVPRCGCPQRGVIKPDVVFFGEIVHAIDDAAELVGGSDLLLVLGSSLVVYPAAMLPELAPGEIVVVNRGEVAMAGGPGRWFIQADLDAYFRQVATAMAG
ncbi:MAG: SIR2 family NAD-dependent protein deacylase [Phycisphaerae bacterium]